MKGQNGFKGFIFEVNVFSHSQIAFLEKEDKTSYEAMLFTSWRCCGDLHKWGPLLISWGLFQ